MGQTECLALEHQMSDCGYNPTQTESGADGRRSKRSCFSVGWAPGAKVENARSVATEDFTKVL